MTTLPQTTPVRLPRPAGNGQLMAPGGMPVVHAGATASATGMSAGDVWRVLRANALLIIAFLIVAGVAGYFINSYLLKTHPKYTAIGYLEVQPIVHPDLTDMNYNGGDVNVVGLEQKTQVAALKAEGLLSQALQNDSSEIRKTKWYETFSRGGSDNSVVKEEFADSFSATAIPETRYVKVEFTGTDPKDCQTIVREICEQHIKNERKAVLDDGQKKSVGLAELQASRLSQDNDLTAKMNQIRSEIAGSGGDVGGHISLKELQLTRLSEQLSKAETEYQAAKSQLDATQESLKKGIDPLQVEQMVQVNQLLTQHKAQVEQYDSQYEQAIDRFGENNPTTIQLKKAFDREQEKTTAMESDARAKARTSYVQELTSLIASATKQRDSVKAAVESATADLADISTKLARYYTYEKQRQSVMEEKSRIDKQLEMLQVAQQQKLENKVSWANGGLPEQPLTPSFPKLKIILPISMAIGLILALSIAFLREMTDTSIRSDRDIVRVGNMQLLGMVGDEAQDPQATGARLPLVIFDAPHSITAEQLRQVRTRLQHAASLDSTRSLLVTSPSPGDGKTTLACNLAAGLALNGRRILLVDGNFRRPEIHKIFAIGNESGFSNVLNGATTFDEAVQETQIPNLAVMTAGPKPVNATEMFESQLLVDFIDRALEEFDHVIFDSGPMMVVSESTAMAPRVDGVVTVVRARGNSRGLLTRMRDTLRALKAEHLGVVLNGVRAQGGGYYGRNIKTFYEYQNG